jgi:hypothetical protein
VKPGDDTLHCLDEALASLEALLKRPDVTVALTTRGINASLALTVVHGLMAYVQGDKAGAIDDLSTVAEEIAARSHNKA